MFRKPTTTTTSNEDAVNLALATIREEFTVMPRFCFHQPLDYHEVTLPPEIGELAIDPASKLPIPSPFYRFGYSPDNTEHYLSWGKYDYHLLLEVVRTHLGYEDGLSILDLGCSTGRVLRHFQANWESSQWILHGCDIQALAIHWMRQCFPDHFVVTTTSTLPHLPFADNTFDFIYGISVFTHIKFLWDAWLLELRRILRPGGVMVQTIHAETAWNFYFVHQNEDWVRASQPSRVYKNETMDVDFLHFGDIAVSQVFWRKDVAVKYWGRYFKIVETRPPPLHSFQDWIICCKL